MNEWFSHLEFLQTPYCHIANCQFEQQWNAENTFLLHPLEKVMPYLYALHIPASHCFFCPHTLVHDLAIHQSEAKRRWLSHHKIYHFNQAVNQDIDQASLPLYFWGLSPQGQQWALNHHKTVGPYPNIEVIKTIHDKKWIEQERGPLDSTIKYHSWITHISELDELIKGYPDRSWMIKRSMYAAGRGNYVLKKPSSIPKKIFHWIDQDKGVLVQPFVERLVDFSSLWYITPEFSIHKLALTRMLTNTQGHYQGCYLGPEQQLLADHQDFLAEHLNQANHLLKACIAKGYFGFIGLDAMIYQTGSKTQTAIIEINARQTLAMHLESIRRTLLKSSSAIARVSKSIDKYSLLPVQQSWNISFQPHCF